MATIFENPGVIDPRCITTQGVNVKETDSPIGHFGTGLKIAIAVLLRHGQGVIIHAGPQVFTFTLKPTTIRGKEFQLVCMNGQELGFTSEFGRDWKLWMAYRELWSNAMDESGRVYQAEDLPDLEDHTQIVVDGIEFDKVHFDREEFLLLDRKPLFVGEEVEVYHGASTHVFYKGIRAGLLPAGKRARFTYNIITNMSLTEDRTLSNSWEVRNAITQTALGAADRGYLITALTESDEECMENQLDYDGSYHTASAEFLQVVEKLKKSNVGHINDKALKRFRKQTYKPITPEGRLITEAEAEVIELARDFAEKLGFPNRSIEVRVAEELGDGVLAIAIRGERKMVLGEKLFTQGIPLVAQAIIEESIHIERGYSDCTREMQTHLFQQIVRLGQLVLA